jgi:hypothetical protein
MNEPFLEWTETPVAKKIENFTRWRKIVTWLFPVVTNTRRRTPAVTLISIAFSETEKRLALQSGWPDWANFCLLGDCFLWVVFYYSSRLFLGQLFPRKNIFINFDKKWVRQHFGQFVPMSTSQITDRQNDWKCWLPLTTPDSSQKGFGASRRGEMIANLY